MMDRDTAVKRIKTMQKLGFTPASKEALDLAIEALEREIEYGQMVVDFTKGETMKSNEWKYDTTCDAESATTTDCISRKQAINALCKECMHGGYDTCSTDCTEVAVLHNLPPVTPPKKVVAQISIDTEELIERIKEEYKITEGEWVDRGRCQVDEDAYDVAICSNCGAEITLEYSYDNFCPNCGAKMGG